MTSALIHDLQEHFNVNVSKAIGLLHSIELFIWLLYAQDVYIVHSTASTYITPPFCVIFHGDLAD